MAATFPAAIKVFTVFHDYTDIIWALSINECHDEIVALEKIVGANPFLGTPFTSVGGAIQYLYNNKAPTNHTHLHHSNLEDAIGNDHPQYMQVTGYPGFSRPVGGVAGSAPADLVPLSRLRSFGFLNQADPEHDQCLHPVSHGRGAWRNSTAWVIVLHCLADHRGPLLRLHRWQWPGDLWLRSHLRSGRSVGPDHQAATPRERWLPALQLDRGPADPGGGVGVISHGPVLT